MRILLLSLLLLSGLSHSQDLQDVIYKKDGSVLRGVLIEQDFNSGRYKIQLNGGSVFAIDKDDIEKITKEAQQDSKSENSVVNINIENSPSINQNPTQSLEQNTQIQPVAYADEKIQNIFFIGTLMHTVKTPEPNYNPFFSEDNLQREEIYKGVKISYQRVHSKHFASHFTLNIGSLDKIEIVGVENNKIYQSYNADGVDYLGLSASIILSSNLQKGWQFFTGLGIAHDVYSFDSGSDEKFDSLALDLGIGYAWQAMQLTTHFQGYLFGDYPDEQDVTNFYLQLGYNF